MKSGQGKSGKMAKYSKKSGKVREIAAKIERKALIIKLFFSNFSPAALNPCIPPGLLMQYDT